MAFVKVSGRYAKSLLDLAQERGELEQVHDDMVYFQQVLENKDFKMVLNSPILSGDKKKEIFKALFSGKVSKLTVEFLDLVLAKGRENILADIARSFIEQYKSIKGISDLKIITAIALSSDSVEKIKQKLIAESGISREVEITVEVDPNLIGGVVLEFEGKQYDASIARKLDELKKNFTQRNLYVSQIEKK